MVEQKNATVTTAQMDRIRELLAALIDQDRARIIVHPKQPAEGFWFGGGNMIQTTDGTLWVVGRYRNKGDSRTGLAAGERGFQLSVLASTDGGRSFEPVRDYSKVDLSYGGAEVLSIEGSCLVPTDGGMELYVSTEKKGIAYPEGLEEFLKPGAGVWTIDLMSGPSVGDVSPSTLVEVVRSTQPADLHVKDPFWYRDRTGREYLLFCTHPFNWSSHNTAYCVRTGDGFSEVRFDDFPRGNTWDVAMFRGTAVIRLPNEGMLADGPPLAVMFYDGGECLRPLEEHQSAVKRPRGYSCEELGGAVVIEDDDFRRLHRVSADRPLFVSPWGTGSSRYVDVLVTEDGYYATWEQSQSDRSQALVFNFLSHDEVRDLLRKA